MLSKFFKVYLLILFFILILTQACSEKDTIPEDKFVKVYVDLLIAKDTTSNDPIPLDSLKSIVLNKYNVSTEQYDNTIDLYNDSPEDWEAFFEKAIAYAEELKAKSVK